MYYDEDDFDVTARYRNSNGYMRGPSIDGGGGVGGLRRPSTDENGTALNGSRSPSFDVATPLPQTLGNPHRQQLQPDITNMAASNSHKRNTSTEVKMATLQRDHASVQKKAFTKWCNIQLSKARRPENADPDEYIIHNLEEDFRDGMRLIHLLEVLSGESLPRERSSLSQRTGTAGRASSVIRIYKIVNVDKALKFLRSKLGDPLQNIGSEDIVDGNVKLTMGLIWVIIHRFRIQTIMSGGVMQPPKSIAPVQISVSDENVEKPTNVEVDHPVATPGNNPVSAPPRVAPSTAKSTLLKWCQQILAPYIDIGILAPITDLGESWRNGIAFLCLVHFFDPKLVPELTELTRRTAARMVAHDSSGSGGKMPSFPTYPTLGQATLDRPLFPTNSSSSTVSSSPHHSRSPSNSSGYQILTPPPSPTSVPPRTISLGSRASASSSSRASSAKVIPALARFLYTTDPGDWMTVLARAFWLAEEYMGVPELLEAADVVAMESVDEKLIMTYVSEFYWVLRDRPHPSATAFPAKISRYLAKADHLTAWLHHRQQEVFRVTWILLSTPEGETDEKNSVTQSGEGGWTREIVEALCDPHGSFERLKECIERGVGRLETELQRVEKVQHEVVDEASVEQYETHYQKGQRKEDADGSALVAQLVALKRAISSLVEELGQHNETVPDVSSVEETHSILMARLNTFISEGFPACVDQLNSYLAWVTHLTSVTTSTRRTLLGDDATGGLKEMVNQTRKEIKGVGREMRLALVQESTEVKGANARRVMERIEGMKAVVRERLGGASVQGWVTESVDVEGEEEGREKPRQSLRALMERVEGDVSARVAELEKLVQNVATAIERDVLRKAD
ncbi:actinin alpha 2, partial [Borealophlyctis nickersoniae]